MKTIDSLLFFALIIVFVILLGKEIITTEETEKKEHCCPPPPGAFVPLDASALVGMAKLTLFIFISIFLIFIHSVIVNENAKKEKKMTVATAVDGVKETPTKIEPIPYSRAIDSIRISY